jgi:hypothetical protein
MVKLTGDGAFGEHTLAITDLSQSGYTGFALDTLLITAHA